MQESLFCRPKVAISQDKKGNIRKSLNIKTLQFTSQRNTISEKDSQLRKHIYIYRLELEKTNYYAKRNINYKRQRLTQPKVG